MGLFPETDFSFPTSLSRIVSMFPIAARPAGPAELPLVMEILDEAARWLVARGIHQWESPPSPDCWAVFRGEIAAERVYIITPEGSDEVVGTFRLTWSGEPLWKDEANAGYLYSLALRPGCIGHGIGSAVIAWLTKQFVLLGKEKFRLDCIAANKQLRAWYEGLGFSYQGIGTDGPYILALYELDLTACKFIQTNALPGA